MQTNQGNVGDAEYRAFLDDVGQRYANVIIMNPVFKTDADDLWDRYIGSFSNPEERQHHNCNACRHFVQRYAGLVVIDPRTGRQYSPLWDENLPSVPANYRAAVAAMRVAVEKARVVSPFYSELKRFGEPKTGVWTHLWANNPKPHTDRLKDSHQTMAAKRQDFIGLKRALSEFSLPVAERAVKLLQAEALTRNERFVGPAMFFAELHMKVAAAIDSKTADNFIWLAVAQNGPGMTHVRSSVIGSLLEDLAAGMAFDDVKARFKDKTKAETYQRAQVAPKIGQVEAAEKAVEALGIAPAFNRRYAQRSDLQRVLWQPQVVVPKTSAVGKTEATGGIFAHLKQQANTALPDMDIPAKKVTWEKFVADVLPGAVHIAYRAPVAGRFCALTAAADADAPQILQWDSSEWRNTVSWSFPQPAATATEWNLTPGAMVPVQMIVPSPNLWREGFELHGKGAFLLLEGAKDMRGHPGGGLFSEHLRGDLKPYRSTIEAHMNQLTVLGADAPDTMAFGIGFMAGGEFTETAAPKALKPGVAGPAPARVHVILVIDDSGSMRSYIGAARNAVKMLLEAVASMPGEVDVTAIKFGYGATVMCSRASVSEAMNCIYQMDASSGGTALNDTLAGAIMNAMGRSDAGDHDTSFFLGVVTDGEENQSKHYTSHSVRQYVAQALSTGRWTIAFAGAGHNARHYADSIGVPPGNVTMFQASARGFEDVGMSYASSTRTLAAGYKSGQRASTSFFAAGAIDTTLGKDHPVFVVQMASGMQMAYEIDRWD